MAISLARLVKVYPFFIRQAIRMPVLHKFLNRKIIDTYASYAPARPHPLSLKSDNYGKLCR
ncbi:MAG: hypothetical protein ABF241_09550 [Yoonia sp.]